MFETLIQIAMLSDDMHETHGIEEEDFNFAVIHYNLMNDPEV
jgi:hypothetical protein